MHPLKQRKTGVIYVLVFAVGFLAAFLALLALANGPSWLYIWRIPGFSLSDKLDFIRDSALNVVRFGGHYLPLSWLAMSSISGYMLAEYSFVRFRKESSTYNHYSWLAPLVLVFGLVLIGFSTGVLFPQAGRFLFTDSPEASMTVLVALLGVTQGVLAAIYTYRWSRHVRSQA